MVYGDETGWREDGRNGYLWSFSTPEVRYFLRRGSRGSKVVAEVLGDEFDGVLVSGFYGAYNVHQGLHQRCWTHLLRDIHQLKERYPQHQGLAQWAQQVREVYDQAQACPGPDPELPETVQRAQRVKLQQQCQHRLLSICKPYLGSDAPMSVLCQRVERFLPELFTFVAEPRAKADNNAAERSLRPTVVSRKISGGNPFTGGERHQERSGFLVRHMALARPQPLPSPELHPLPTPARPSLNSYARWSALTSTPTAPRPRSVVISTSGNRVITNTRQALASRLKR